MTKSKTIGDRLFWKIAAALLIQLLLLGVMYIFITAYVSKLYMQEANQKLYGHIATHIVKEVQPLVDGKVDTVAIKDIMHSMMVINPNVEVYLLDMEGNIITFMAPKKRVKLKKIDLKPVIAFINKKDDPKLFVGDDPRSFNKKKVFSAAPITENNTTTGYVYVILASEEQASILSPIMNSYILKLGANIFFLALLGALIIGLFAVWFLTRNLRIIIDTVRRFKDGDYQARIPASKGDLKILPETFNEMADQIVDNIDKIKSVEKLRRELIANVSHDLRTPLSIMQGYIETMMIKKDNLNPEEQQRYLKIVLESSEKLSKLVSQLFEYSKLEAREITPKKEPFLISELVQDVFVKYQIVAKEKNIEMLVDIPQHTPLVFADVGLVERVIQNLMDNAIKFTPEHGKVSLQLTTKKNHVEVSISDTGPGIPEQEQAFIFERFSQTKTGEAKTGSAGLGLAIAKKIMDIHDSTIKVISQPNEGASFIFNLPAYR